MRPAEVGDLDDVATVWHESALAMDGAVPDMPSRDALRRRADAELQSGWQLYVAAIGGRIVGMLALKPREAVLDQIFVLPAEQGKGVGRALLAAAKQAMPIGFTLRMAASNEQAGRFYEKEGLERIGEGTHPQTGIRVHFYGWNVRRSRRAAAWSG